jgi:hypothetical protein
LPTEQQRKESAMTAITSSIPPAITPKITTPAIDSGANKADLAASGASAPNSFGPAVKVSLSAPAKSIVEAPASQAGNELSAPQSSTVSSSHPSTTAVDSDGGAQTAPKTAPVVAAAPNVFNNPANTIASSKAKVALQVGVAAANQLVDKNGNIDKVRLAVLVAEQQTAKPGSN